jgi:hypothetical protein
MGWNDRLDPDAYDWGDPADLQRAANDALMQGARNRPAKQNENEERGECWSCGAPDVPLVGIKKYCGWCFIADRY